MNLPEQRVEARQDLQPLNVQKMGNTKWDSKEVDSGEQLGETTMQGVLVEPKQKSLPIDDVTTIIAGRWGSFSRWMRKSATYFTSQRRK